MKHKLDLLFTDKERAEIFKYYIIIPVLNVLDLPKQMTAAQLLLGTAIKESELMYTYQIGGGPAKGYWQMEGATERSIYDDFLKYRPLLLSKVNSFKSEGDDIATNPKLACALARIAYYRKSEPLPAFNEIKEQAEFWKKHYNTQLGKGTVEQYINLWSRYVG